MSAAAPSSPFRAAAVAARGQQPARGPDDALQVVPPGLWWLFIIVASSVLAALAFAWVTPVNISCVGRARLLEPEGTVLMRAPADAYLDRVPVRSGDRVAAGQVLVSFRSPEREAAVVEATLHRELAERTLEKRRDSYRTTQASLQQLLAGLVGVSNSSLAQQERISKLMQQRAEARQNMADAGVLPGLDAQLSEIELRKATQELSSIKGNGLAARATLAEWNLQANRLLEEAEERLESARASEQSTRKALEQLTVRAEVAGRIEGLYLKPGSFVSSGTELGKLVPEGKPSRVVAFVPESDRAFLSAQTSVRLELDQLPAGEFGIVRGVVQRVGVELASAAEMRAELGHDEEVSVASYRVDVEVQSVTPELAARLRSGMLGNAHFALRERRIISLLLAPLKQVLR